MRPPARLPAAIRIALAVLGGILVALLTWYFIDLAIAAQQRELFLLRAGRSNLLRLAVVGLIGFVLLWPSRIALAAALVTLTAGLLVGSWFPETLPTTVVDVAPNEAVDRGGLDLRLIASRGAWEPALYLVWAGWAGILIMRWVTTRGAPSDAATLAGRGEHQVPDQAEPPERAPARPEQGRSQPPEDRGQEGRGRGGVG